MSASIILVLLFVSLQNNEWTQQRIVDELIKSRDRLCARNCLIESVEFRKESENTKRIADNLYAASGGKIRLDRTLDSSEVKVWCVVNDATFRAVKRDSDSVFVVTSTGKDAKEVRDSINSAFRIANAPFGMLQCDLIESCYKLKNTKFENISFSQADGDQYLEFDVSNPDWPCLLYTSPSPRDLSTSRMPSSA